MTRSLRPLALLLLPLAAAAQPALFTPADDARAALAPRQSELLGHLERIPAAVEVRLVEAHLEHLAAPALRFNLLPGVEATLTLDRTEYRLGDGASYFFESEDASTFAVVVAREGRITGSVRIAGRLYAVRPLTGGLHAVARVDEGRFVDHGPEWAAVEGEAARRWAGRDPLADPPGAPGAPEGGPVVQRVLVPYTPNAESQAGDIVALVQLAIDETNAGYAYSGIDLRLALAHTYRTNENEADDFVTTLNRMVDPADGHFDEIPGLREAHGADLVNLIVGYDGGLCGRALTFLAAGPEEAFAATAHPCAAGYYTFGHELGHLQGARHNPEADPNLWPFPYGHGKLYVPGRWRTVMSYDCDGGCPRILRWSSPDVLYNGEPTGDAALRDNARVLEETAETIAAFYPDPAGAATVAVERLSPGTVGPGGGPVRFRVTVSNASGAPFAGEGWVTATLPDGTDYGPLFGPRAVALANGEALTRTLTVRVPAAAPAGTYTVTAYAGTAYPDDVDDSAAFAFTKEAGALAGERADGEPMTAAWTVTEEAPSAAASATGDAPPAALLGVAPNPLRGAATVRYAVGAAGPVRVAVYDVLGREVAVLADGAAEAGEHAAALDAGALPVGVYVVRVTAGGPAAAQRVTVLR